MNLKYLFIGLGVLCTVGALMIGGRESALSILFGGAPDPEFKVPLWKPISFVVACMLATGIVGGALGMASETETEWKKFTTGKAEAQKEEDARAERERIQREIQAAELRGQEALERTVSALRDEFGAEPKVEVVRPDFRIVQVVGRSRETPLSHKVIRAVVDDIYGNKKAIVVIHMFEGKATWQYDSSNTFDPPNFLEEVRTSSEAATFRTYEFVVGIGLSSNSPTYRVGQAKQRARFLCGALSSFDGLDSDGRVFGLSIGAFTGDDQDSLATPKAYQRPVVIVGVEEMSTIADQELLLIEVMMSVEYSGIDLRDYRGLATGEDLQWFETRECVGPA